jgi:peptide/nickel transport system ATP-binding protein
MPSTPSSGNFSNAMTVETPPVLSIDKLRVEFPTRRGTLVALDDVSLHIEKSEILGVVGESGAGKSLTGSAVIGLLPPPGCIVAGAIHLSERRIDTLSQADLQSVRGREIGAIFQDPLTSLNPLYTIAKQLIQTIQTHSDLNHRQARAKALDLLRAVGIPSPEQRLDNYPHVYSGGMRQRIVIALALAADPSLVIADEPTTALDVSVQAQIIALLKSLCRERGTACMLITHDMGVIAETADRVVVMYAGRLVEIGAVDAVINRPLHPYTQGLMGAIPPLKKKVERLSQIEGSMPQLNSIPDGCAFHPRCERSTEKCRAARPPMIERNGGQVACWLHAEETP